MGCTTKARDSDREKDLVVYIIEMKDSSDLGLQIAVCVWYLEFGTGFSSVEQGNKRKVRVRVGTMRLDSMI